MAPLKVTDAMTLLLRKLACVGALLWVVTAGAADPQNQPSGDAAMPPLDSLAQALRANPQLLQQVSEAVGQTSPTTTTPSSNAPATTSNNAASTAPRQAAATSSTTAEQSAAELAAAEQQGKIASSPQGQARTQSTPPQTTNNPAPAAVEVSPEMADEIREQAFDAVKQEAFPLTPEQIKELRRELDKTQRATATEPYEETPKPTSSSLLVNLAPGSTPPVIRLSRGFVTSLVFIDSTGAPWPIKGYDLGNPSAFNISWNQKDNTLFVQARSTYTYGNLAIVLEGLDTPVMITLVPGQKVIDYRVDLRLPSLGPNAKPVIQGTGLPEQADQTLLSILDGIPPKGAKRLTVEGNVAEVWVIKDRIYVRTRYNVLSPAWIAKMSSADGTNAFMMQKTPMLLISRQGKIGQVRLEGF